MTSLGIGRDTAAIRLTKRGFPKREVFLDYATQLTQQQREKAKLGGGN